MQGIENNLAGLSAYAPPVWDQLPDLGLYMDQVITYMERHYRALYPQSGSILTPSMINNYVKYGLVTRPVGKKYDREQLAQLMMLLTLKQAASLEEMKQLLTPPKGESIRELYDAFLKTNQQVVASLNARPGEATAMQYAIEAAAFRYLCAQKLLSQPAPAEKEGKRGGKNKAKPEFQDPIPQKVPEAEKGEA